MTGNWKGWYEFDDNGLTVKTNFDRATFTLLLEAINGVNFYGTIQDHIGSTIKDDFSMIGCITKGKIAFTKFKSIQRVRNVEEFKKFKEENPIIYYQGIISPDKKEVSGTWKSKFIFQFLFGFIPVLRRAKGIWAMQFEV